MPEETKAETMDLVVTACEKFSASNEVAFVFSFNYSPNSSE